MTAETTEVTPLDPNNPPGYETALVITEHLGVLSNSLNADPEDMALAKAELSNLGCRGDMVEQWIEKERRIERGIQAGAEFVSVDYADAYNTFVVEAEETKFPETVAYFAALTSAYQNAH